LCIIFLISIMGKCDTFVFSNLAYSFFFIMLPVPPISTLFPYTTLFRSGSRTGTRRRGRRQFSLGGLPRWGRQRRRSAAARRSRADDRDRPIARSSSPDVLAARR